jgi:hypothetical protein
MLHITVVIAHIRRMSHACHVSTLFAVGHQLQLRCRCLINSLVCFLKSNRNEHEELAAWLCVPPLRLSVALGGCISLVYNRAAVYNSRFVMAGLDGLNYHLIPVISIVRCG